MGLECVYNEDIFKKSCTVWIFNDAYIHVSMWVYIVMQLFHESMVDSILACRPSSLAMPKLCHCHNVHVHMFPNSHTQTGLNPHFPHVCGLISTCFIIVLHVLALNHCCWKQPTLWTKNQSICFCSLDVVPTLSHWFISICSTFPVLVV